MVEAPEHRITVHLDELLVARGMTLVELSARVGVTVANLSILKNGRARALRFNTLTAICDALDCTPGDVLGLQEKSAPPHVDRSAFVSKARGGARDALTRGDARCLCDGLGDAGGMVTGAMTVTSEPANRLTTWHCTTWSPVRPARLPYVFASSS